MSKQLFTNIGLNENEAEVYDFLISHGESPAQSIITNTSLKKGVIYNTLETLIEHGLVTKKLLRPKNPKVRNKQKIAYFTATHPNHLLSILEHKEQGIIESKNNLVGNLPILTSMFNLSSGKPGIRIYEGDKGIKEALADSLTSTETIRTYSDIDAIINHIHDLNTEYVQKRKEFNIKKRAISIDTPQARKFLQNYYTNITETRLISSDKFTFNSVSEIYDNKVSYITFSKNTKIAVIINDPEIYKMNVAIFEHAWKNAKKFEG